MRSSLVSSAKDVLGMRLCAKFLATVGNMKGEGVPLQSCAPASRKMGTARKPCPDCFLPFYGQGISLQTTQGLLIGRCSHRAGIAASQCPLPLPFTGLVGAVVNCSSSVEPVSAVVDALPWPTT